MYGRSSYSRFQEEYHALGLGNYWINNWSKQDPCLFIPGLGSIKGINKDNNQAQLQIGVRAACFYYSGLLMAIRTYCFIGRKSAINLTSICYEACSWIPQALRFRLFQCCRGCIVTPSKCRFQDGYEPPSLRCTESHNTRFLYFSIY